MGYAALVIVALLLAAPPTAGAVELLLGWDARTVWDSNVLRDESDKESDFSILTGPNLRARERRGDLRWDVSYRPRYQVYLDLEDADTFEHYADFSSDWSISRRTELRLDNRFARTRTLNDVLEDPIDASGEVVIDRTAVLRNSTSATLLHRLSPRSELEFNLGQQFYEFQDDRRSDSRAFRGAATLRRALDTRQTVGFGFAGSRQDFQETTNRPENGTTIVEGFAYYRVLLSRNLTLSLTGGPRWSFPDELDDEQEFSQYVTTGDGFLFRASCVPAPGCAAPVARAPFFDLQNNNVPVAPIRVASMPRVDLPFVGGEAPEQEDSFNYSAAVSLAYWRKRYGAELGYTRGESPNSGLGVSTNLDVVSLRGSWEPANRWRLSFVSSWEKQTSENRFTRQIGVVSGVPAQVLLDAQGRVVSDLADARYLALDVAEFAALSSGDDASADFEIEAYRFQFRVEHDLTRRLQLRGAATWWEQTSQQTGRSDRTVDNLRFELGLTWSFAPIIL